MFQPHPQFRRTSRVDFSDDIGRTEQAHKTDVDIHHIMKQYKKTGVLTHVNQHQGTYGDYAEAPDYSQAQNIIADAKSLFESVPSHIRSDMNNDPQQFVNFMQNPKNREEIEAYGLDASHLPSQDATPKTSPSLPKPSKPSPETKEEPSGDS
nr:MAG: internal scaffolding protein [Microvirus sp.]